MTDFDPISGKEDKLIVGVVREHVETPLKTLIALENIILERIESVAGVLITAAAMEDAVADLVTSALALITASWQAAGLDLGIMEDGTSPEVEAWCSSILDQCLDAVRVEWHALKLDYAANVGPIRK